MDEFDETFLRRPGEPDQRHGRRRPGAGTITDDDASPLLSISNVSVAEGDAGTTTASFDVSLSAPSGKIVTVDTDTADGTALQPADYAGATGTLTFNPGQVSRSFAVTVDGDVLDEFDETFIVDLSGAVNAARSPTPRASARSWTTTRLPRSRSPTRPCPEGDAGTTVASFAVSLSAPSGKTVSVDYLTSDGTAGQPVDYAAAAGTVTFTPGQTAKIVDVTINGDTMYEIDETFALDLATPIQASPGAMNATGTIQDDDPLPTASVDDRDRPRGRRGRDDDDVHRLALQPELRSP